MAPAYGRSRALGMRHPATGPTSSRPLHKPFDLLALGSEHLGIESPRTHGAPSLTAPLVGPSSVGAATDAAPSGDPMMTTHLPAETCELRPVKPVTARVRMPDFRLIALLTKPTPLTAEEWAYVEAVEVATGGAE
ncbi:hypothetical protein ASG11_04800 [Sphingomonas sp. Leaf357]|nr:hypothetical protein ASG11_04800 [Sphingomonas sp. Leaf357]